MKDIRNYGLLAHNTFGIDAKCSRFLEYVTERNEPTAQMDKLKEIFQHIKEDKLPTTREDFESQAMLYHILMDLEDFLIYKKRFVNSLDDKQKQRYWNQGK